MRTLPKHPRPQWLLSLLLVSALSVASMAMALEVGEPAPDFTLPSCLVPGCDGTDSW